MTTCRDQPQLPDHDLPIFTIMDFLFLSNLNFLFRKVTMWSFYIVCRFWGGIQVILQLWGLSLWLGYENRSSTILILLHYKKHLIEFTCVLYFAKVIFFISDNDSRQLFAHGRLCACDLADQCWIRKQQVVGSSPVTVNVLCPWARHLP